MKKRIPEPVLREEQPCWPDGSESPFVDRTCDGGDELCSCLVSETGILGALARDFQAVFGST